MWGFLEEEEEGYDVFCLFSCDNMIVQIKRSQLLPHPPFPPQKNRCVLTQLRDQESLKRKYGYVKKVVNAITDRWQMESIKSPKRTIQNNSGGNIYCIRKKKMEIQ